MSSRKRNTRLEKDNVGSDEPSVEPLVAQPKRHRWDDTDPHNWTAPKLRKELQILDISVQPSLDKSNLLKLWLRNKHRVRRTHTAGDTQDTEIMSEQSAENPVEHLSSSAAASSDADLIGTAEAPAYIPGSVRAQQQHPAAVSTCFDSIQQSLLALQSTVLNLGARIGSPVAADTYRTTNHTPIIPPSTHTLSSVMMRQAEPGPAGGLSVSFGMSPNDLHHQELVSPSLKQAIIAGKDVNLNMLLIQNYEFGEVRSVEIGEHSFRLKKSDARLMKALSIQEFVTAFNRFKRIMCEAFPSRREELDLYLQNVINISTNFPGTPFFEYHRQFSAQAAAALTRGIKVDWSILDTVLYCKVTAGHKVKTCFHCGTMSHDSDMCPAKTEEPADKSTRSTGSRGGRIKVMHNGREVCNHFNGDFGCVRRGCTYEHVCKICFRQHSASDHKNQKSVNVPKSQPAIAAPSQIPKTVSTAATKN